ncbi:hypothetical protein C8R45DRAFT_932041 [Mycena sanguinolenta]|nr:hypothetical protein C8R45DRAFT_932041 [Mycena sanguinolenta]
MPGYSARNLNARWLNSFEKEEEHSWNTRNIAHVMLVMWVQNDRGMRIRHTSLSFNCAFIDALSAGNLAYLGPAESVISNSRFIADNSGESLTNYGLDCRRSTVLSTNTFWVSLLRSSLYTTPRQKDRRNALEKDPDCCEVSPYSVRCVWCKILIQLGKQGGTTYQWREWKSHKSS